MNNNTQKQAAKKKQLPIVTLDQLLGSVKPSVQEPQLKKQDDLFGDLVSYDVPASGVAVPQNNQEPSQPQMGLPEALVRRAGQGLGGLGDEAEGALRTVEDYSAPTEYSDMAERASQKYLGMSTDQLPQERIDMTELLSDLFNNPGSIKEKYLTNKGTAQQLNDQALEQHPSSFVGDLAGTAASLAMGGPTLAMGVSGFGNSEGNIFDSPGQVALDTGLGLAGGKLLQKTSGALEGGMNKLAKSMHTPNYTSVGKKLNSVLGVAAPVIGGLEGYRRHGASGAFLGAAGAAVAKNNMVSPEMIKKVPQAANWLLKKFTPLAKVGLQTAIMEIFPSYMPSMSRFMDVQDRQTVSNVIMNNDNLDTEQKASRVERIMKEGSFRYDDMPDDWYIMRGVEPEVQDMPIQRTITE